MRDIYSHLQLDWFETTAAAVSSATFTNDDDTFVGGNGVNDSINALGGDDVIATGSGDDTILGGTGDDILSGQSGADSLVGAAGDDILSGGSGLDVLSGGLGNDQISGGAGADRITGGKGRDDLTGGSGADVFAYDTVQDSRGNLGLDRIADFEHGKDKIDISAIAATAGVTSFTVVSLFHGAVGEIQYSGHGDETQLDVDLDGDGHSDFTLLISSLYGGPSQFQISDFIT